MITYVKGDLLETPHRVIVHGCNTRGVMGAGVAKQIKFKYPGAFTAYKSFTERNPNCLGFNAYYIEPDTGKIIVNAITQDTYGRGGKYVSYDALDECMYRLNLWLIDVDPSATIAMPKIGSGLGGGDWTVCSMIINSRLRTTPVVIYTID